MAAAYDDSLSSRRICIRLTHNYCSRHPKADRALAALQKAKGELEALQYAAGRAGQVLDRMPLERRDKWLRQARDDFQQVRIS
jgi:hypothetical protein